EGRIILHTATMGDRSPLTLPARSTGRTIVVTRRLLALLGCLSLPVLLASSAEAGKTVDFARDVRPILANNCFACHGPDPKTRQAGLRLDVRTEAVKPGRSGTAAIVPRTT